MARDYARGKGKGKKAKQKSGVSSIRLFLTLIIVGGFAMALFFLSQQPKDEEAPVPTKQASQQEQQTAPATPAAPSEPTKPASKPATEQADKNGFDFYQLLPESEVEAPKVEAYKSTPKDPNKKTNTLLQAGSFRNKKDADSLRAKLILLNLPNVVVEKTTSSSGSVWYRVRVGPFDNRSMLNKAEDILAQNHIAPLRINRK